MRPAWVKVRSDGGAAGNEGMGPETDEDDALPARKEREVKGMSLLRPSISQPEIPSTPAEIYAFGMDESAYVWWDYTFLDNIKVEGWIVKRYRLEATGAWSFKGIVNFANSPKPKPTIGKQTERVMVNRPKLDVTCPHT